MGGRRGLHSLLLAAAVVVGTATTVGATTASGPTLWQRAFEASLVVRARIVHPRWEIPVGEPATPYPVVEAEVLEVLKGEAARGRLTFARDGHEQPPFVSGQETVLFLTPVATSARLGQTTIAGAVEWASFPAPVENIVLTTANRNAFLAAIRGYTTIAAMPQSAERGARLRTLTIELVTSPEPALAQSALRDLSLAGNAPLLTRTEAGRIGTLVFDPNVPIDTRLALLRELERRGLIFGPTAWARLLRETRGADQRAVLLAVTSHQSTAVNIELEKLLRGRDRRLAIAAAEGLGSVGNHDAVRPLLRELDRPEPTLRLAIVRSLGNIRTQSAREALDLVAESHPDTRTRQAALAQVVVLARRHGTTIAPMRQPVSTARAPGTAR